MLPPKRHPHGVVFSLSVSGLELRGIPQDMIALCIFEASVVGMIGQVPYRSDPCVCVWAFLPLSGCLHVVHIVCVFCLLLLCSFYKYSIEFRLSNS